MSLIEQYKRKIASGEMLEDSRQIQVLEALQPIYDTLTTQKTWIKRLLSAKPKGLYLWGSVGIGKTFLMDIFFQALPFEQKWRTHFLPFMQAVHEQLKVIQGQKNPLKKIAQTWAQKTRVICFDEFLVNDVADAMILGELLNAFFAEGICMILTSNLAPDALYKNGIQRALFLPAIANIKAHTQVIHLEMIQDYRTRYASEQNYYWYPLTTQTQAKMDHAFQTLTQGEVIIETPLMLYHRSIAVKKRTNQVIWFDFKVICGIPRNQKDYMALAKQFKIMLISDLTPMRKTDHDWARSWIQLIDVLYDAKVKLIISAALPMQQIYVEGPLVFEFQRTLSRMVQMQQWT